MISLSCVLFVSLGAEERSPNEIRESCIFIRQCRIERQDRTIGEGIRVPFNGDMCALSFTSI